MWGCSCCSLERSTARGFELCQSATKRRTTPPCSSTPRTSRPSRSSTEEKGRRGAERERGEGREAGGRAAEGRRGGVASVLSVREEGEAGGNFCPRRKRLESEKELVEKREDEGEGKRQKEKPCKYDVCLCIDVDIPSPVLIPRTAEGDLCVFC